MAHLKRNPQSDTCETVRTKPPVIEEPGLLHPHQRVGFNADVPTLFGVDSKPSDGLTVPQIKDALTAKAIDIPAGTTLRADLAALLDSAPAA